MNDTLIQYVITRGGVDYHIEIRPKLRQNPERLGYICDGYEITSTEYSGLEELTQSELDGCLEKAAAEIFILNAVK